MSGTGTKTIQHPVLKILRGPTVSDEKPHIHANGQDKITWQCDYDLNWKVHFENSPFQNNKADFDRQHDTTPPAKQDAQGYYKYTVTTVDGSEDPGVFVDG